MVGSKQMKPKMDAKISIQTGLYGELDITSQKITTKTLITIDFYNKTFKMKLEAENYLLPHSIIMRQ